MIEYLGVDGMSSDDSETGALDRDLDVPRYRIRTPQWRADLVEPWLRTFDSVHTILRRAGASDDSRSGAFPRIRTATNQKSTSKTFVSGLPINAYDPKWVQKDILREYDLHPDAAYDFTHDPDVHLCVA